MTIPYNYDDQFLYVNMYKYNTKIQYSILILILFGSLGNLSNHNSNLKYHNFRLNILEVSVPPPL